MINGKPLRDSPFPLVCSPITLVHISDFDKKGFIWFVCTGERRHEWKSPVTEKWMEISSSPAKFGSVESILENRNAEFYTEDKVGSWVQLSIVNSGFKLRPTHYTLRHGYNYGSFMLRNWNFEASIDGTTWKVLKEHKDDVSLTATGFSTFTWPVEADDSYSHFRITTTGPNANGSNQLMVGGFELYGHLTRSKKVTMVL